ncbi:hypothetical protein CspeluHIS016_0405070 [Cutaneotrichosporon spelunceum]|uniref:Uncharacterized protein n=1 Tax=Cutaneotrichosporon spelunceum TaxID=1672016 RepID=A0AAD3TVH7_9TREE|nr:hypothetical protein CspeluHIS016_0405070 [Cutaneotrichosporon spelunceum]
MSRSTPQRSANRETLEILNPFLQVVRSDGPIPIPVNTLKGAIGHFLVTLEGEQLDGFVADILHSKSLSRKLSPAEVAEAVRPAPAVKVRNLKPDLKDGWFSRDNLGKACRAWLKQVFVASKKSKSDNAVYLYAGLLAGADDAEDVKWGQPREDIEEEVVVALSERLYLRTSEEKKNEKEVDLEPALKTYCRAAGHIDAARLRVLDLRKVAPQLHNAIFDSLGYPSVAGRRTKLDLQTTKELSRGLSRTITALSQGGDQDQALAWETARAYVARMLDCGEGFQAEWTKRTIPASGSAEAERQKVALVSFTQVTWPVVEMMLEPHSYGSKRERIDLASHIVLTMGKFSSLAQEDSQSEGFENVLYGCLDLIAANGKSVAVRQLLEELNRPKVSDSLAGFILIVAEQLIRLIDAQSMRDIVFPLAQKYIVRPNHRASFEAANAFMLTLLDTASSTLATDMTQGPFVDALTVILAHSLLRHARDGSVKADQLSAAYPLLVKAASRRSTDLVGRCFSMLDNATFSNKEYEFAVKKIRIMITPYILRSRMAEYLDSIAKIITDTPRDSEARLELSGIAFKVVMGEVPDESKQMAVEWWLKWRRRFEGGTDAAQARL